MIKKLIQLFIPCAVVIGVSSAMADDDRHRHQLPKDVDAFHAVLAPVWHATPGKERLQTACAKANEMEGLAKEIRSTDASQLVGAVARLRAKCQGDRTDVEAGLGEVHDAFHHLIEPKPAVKAR